MSSTVLDAAMWQLVDSYLDQALDLDVPAREGWLAELTLTQPAIAGTLRDLLDEHAQLQAEGFLDEPASLVAQLAATANVCMTGRVIGAYTIDRLIGRGGMGEVWLASRSDGRFEGRCAIKFLDSTVVQPKLVERFRWEGRVLGRLAHPNIARLLDAGATEDGRQFLVLEYIDGQRIDAFCEAQGLEVESRVRLFLDVVSAVAHAHSQLVVHRDLKPSNVFVADGGTVKLLDFGIAKLLAGDSGGDETVTRIEESALTPEYAAPEQLLGELPTTATDVYQLGMLLYVLLTGAHPFPRGSTRAERIKIALEGRIPRASQAASGKLRKQLRGDLDAILATALQIDPKQRYSTAAALREDLSRYLNRESVRARQGTMFYHAARFVVRHRIAVLASAFALASLCATLLFALEQARAAATERDRALDLASRNSAVTDFLGTLITEAAEADKPVTVPDMLDRSERLAMSDTSGPAENRAAVLAMIASRYGALGEADKAARLQERALTLLEGTHETALRAEIRCQRARVITDLGQIEAALRIIDAELANLDDAPDIAAGCLLSRSIISGNRHDAEATLHYAQQGLERARVARHKHSSDEALLLAMVAYGHHLYGRNREAERYFEQSIVRFAQLGREGGPDALSVRNNWAVSIDEAGVPRRALELYETTLRLFAQRNPGGEPPAFVMGNRGGAFDSLGMYDQALASSNEELRIARAAGNAMGQAHALKDLASIYQHQGQPDIAQRYLDEFATLLAPMPADSPPWTSHMIIQARIDIDHGRLDAARERFTQALGREIGSAATITARLGRAEAELRAGYIEAAADDARVALGIAKSLQGDLPYADQTGHASLILGRALKKMGRTGEAQAALEVAVANLSHTVDDKHPAAVQARQLLAQT